MFLQKGISLTEILVVLMILSASVSLVAPLTIERVEKSKIKFEQKELSLLLKKLQRQAKWTRSTIEIKASGRNLQVFANGAPLEIKRFDKIKLSKQTLVINSKGYPESCLFNIKYPASKLEAIFPECIKNG